MAIFVFIALVSVQHVNAFDQPKQEFETAYVVILEENTEYKTLSSQIFYKDKSHIIILANLSLHGSKDDAQNFFFVLLQNGAAYSVPHLNYPVEFDSSYDGFTIYKVVR